MDDLFSNYKISAWNTFGTVFQPQVKSWFPHIFPLQSYSIKMLKYTLILILHNWNWLCQNIIILIFWKTPRLFVFGHLLKFINVHFANMRYNLFLPLWKIWMIKQNRFSLMFQCEKKGYNYFKIENFWKILDFFGHLLGVGTSLEHRSKPHFFL